MAQFETGKVIRTNLGEPIKIIKWLASGGQGDVYIAEYRGEQKALKWYKNVGKNPDAFYDNLKCNVDKGSPDKAFLWPEAITEKVDGSFGYIMNLRPEGYYELSEFMVAKNVKFASFVAATEACIRIVSAFRILHNNGYSYQDLNDGNFFINPKNGDVLICDNDNVAPNETSMGVMGKSRYMAPEIVCHTTLPNTQTDRFSLSIILFMILFMNHPLEGKRHVNIPCLTNALAEKLYGSEALFIYDPNDSSNEPVRNIHKNVIARWGYMPGYIKEAFLKAFSQDAIKEPGRRLRELDWLKLLVRFRSEIIRCSCKNEVFIQNASTTKCDSCGKPIEITHTIKLPNYSISAAKGSRVYRCQLGTCNADEALSPVFLVVAKDNDPKVLGLKNMTDIILNAETPGGKPKRVQPKEVIPFIKGIKVEIYDCKIELV